MYKNMKRIFFFRVKIEYWIGDELLFDSNIYSILEYCVLYFRVWIQWLIQEGQSYCHDISNEKVMDS